MNKTELVAAVAAKAEISKKDAEAAVKAVIVGFGTFDVKTRAARTGKNPRTGESISIPEAKVPSFKAGSALKDAVK